MLTRFNIDFAARVELMRFREVVEDASSRLRHWNGEYEPIRFHDLPGNRQSGHLVSDLNSGVVELEIAQMPLASQYGSQS